MKNFIKTKFTLFILVLLPLTLLSQQSDSLLFELEFKSMLTALNAEDSAINELDNNSILQHIKSNNWDSNRYNPYEKQRKKEPFEIAFHDSTFASPIKRKKMITSRYGWRNGRPHQGIDIDLVTGDSVMAMFDGIVRFAKYSSGHGRTVIIRHKNGLETAYTHLSKYNVKTNDVVKKGQLIGKGGTSGNARGSHLHLVVSYQGNYINPEYLFDFGSSNGVKADKIWITKYWYTASFHNAKRQSKLEYFNSYEEALAHQNKQYEKQIYIVKRGDTLSGISNKYRVSVNKICKTNSIRKNSVLKIGEKLIIN